MVLVKRLEQTLLVILLIAPYLVLSGIFIVQRVQDSASIRTAQLLYPPATALPDSIKLAAYNLQIPTGESTSIAISDLTLITRDGAVIGQGNIRNFLTTQSWTRPRPTIGLRAALIMVGLQGIVLLYRRSLLLYAVFFVPIGILAAMAYAIPCVSCGSVKVTDLAPTLSLVLLGSVGLVLCFQESTPKAVRLGMLAGLTAAPSVQATLLFREPLLCPLCTVLGTLMGILALALFDLFQGAQLPVFPGRGRTSYILACSAAIIFQTGRVSLLSPNLKPTLDSDAQIVARLIGKRSDTLIPGSTERNNVLLIARDGCTSCIAAKNQLKADKVPHRELPACSFGAQGECFDLDATPIGFPTILFVDSNGMVRDARIGWPSDQQDVFALTEKMRNWRRQ